MIIAVYTQLPMQDPRLSGPDPRGDISGWPTGVVEECRVKTKWEDLEVSKIPKVQNFTGLKVCACVFNAVTECLNQTFA